MADKKEETTELGLKPLFGAEEKVDVHEAIASDPRVARFLGEASEPVIDGAKKDGGSEDLQVAPFPVVRVVEANNVTRVDGFNLRLVKFYSEVFGIDLTREHGPVTPSSKGFRGQPIQLFVCSAPSPLTLHERHEWRMKQFNSDAMVPWYTALFLGIMKFLGRFKEQSYEPPEIEKRDSFLAQLIRALELRGFELQYVVSELADLQNKRHAAPSRGLWMSLNPWLQPPDFWSSPESWSMGGTLEEELLFILYRDWLREQLDVAPMNAVDCGSSIVVCTSTMDAHSEKMAAVKSFSSGGSNGLWIRFISPQSAACSPQCLVRLVFVVV